MQLLQEDSDENYCAQFKIITKVSILWPCFLRKKGETSVKAALLYFSPDLGLANHFEEKVAWPLG